ncbi:MAG TPA: HAMP domain-containing sensor histidine kinase [Vicinamibacterales bacterium]|nr:HAMP domain-containing sensor histidine kinase [Vicinamibacterales bacterium]
MEVPHFVRRVARRVVGGGLAGIVAVAAGGFAGERLRFGADFPAARDRIAADVQRQFSTLSRQLDAAVGRVKADPVLPAAVATRETAARRDLFERVADAAATLSQPTVALSVYGMDARAVAWAGRPSPLPNERIIGPDALFLAPSSTGLRLTRVSPVVDPAAPERRIATIVAEAPLSRATDTPAAEDFVLQTSLIPVPLRLTFESGANLPGGAIVVRDAGGLPLARVDVSGPDVEQARRRWRDATAALVLALLGVVLLLLTGPLLDWRRLARTVVEHVTLTLVLVMSLLAARVCAWFAVRLAGLDSPPLVPPELAGPFVVAFASPADFLLSALLWGACVGLAASSFEQWRHARRLRVRVVPDGGTGEVAAFILAQVASGALVGMMLVGYESFLRTRLALMPYDVLHFSLHPFDWARLSVGIGLVIAHAAILALAVLVFRMAMARWVVAGDRRWVRAWVPVLWAVPAMLVFIWTTREWEAPPVFPAALVVAVAIAAAWRLRRYRAALEHASQAARLTALFVALAVPSVVFYPSLVDAAGRARRQVIEARHAPEVVNQRRNLQLQLNEALAQIDALPDLAELVQVGDPVVTGPAPFETAFRVWERTVLERLRLTSSVELHDEAGALVSRFALKLPRTAGPSIYQEDSCEWELYGEVSPFFAEERRLLHAGRGICVEGPEGRQVVGAIAIHVTLDYSNLSFISAQSPYAALLRGGEVTERSPREAVEFTVYGWSRRPLYMSGRDAWPLTEDIFERIYASREPFWARAAIGDEDYDVYFLNDRGGIYALGYALTSPFGHMISVAEVVVLSATTFALALLAGLIYGRIAARTPMSGRALLREVRASFYRKLFIAFVAAAVVPVLALALVTRAYIANLMQADLETEAARTAASASRVVEDVGLLEVTGATGPGIVDDDLVVWLSRVIAQDVNIFDSGGLLASSERSLYAYGLLPRSTQGDVYREIVLDGRPSYVTRETVGLTEYLVSAAPVRVQNREAILTVPLTLRQQEIEAEIDELDRRVLLAAVLFIILGAVIGYSMAERIADPVNRLMKATGRIARGDLDARIQATSSDEFRRLVEAFNRMAADLQRQRVELERSHRLAAWADMARQVAHDIKNPLTPIQLNAEHLQRVHDDRGAPLGPVLDECVTNVLNQVRLLRQIASEFSSFATSPTVKPVPEALHLTIADVVEAYRTGLKGQVAIDVDVPETLPRVLVDKAVLARGLTNVIENALHAMPRGGSLQLSARLTEANEVELAIADTGIGMDSAALERIFEPYFSTRASGTGLGLTIAKRNVELNGGTILVTSQRDKGTTVRITLPTVRAAG